MPQRQIQIGPAELDALSRMAYAEARGESRKGQHGVIAVAINRAMAQGFPNDIIGVLNQRNAFSPVTAVGSVANLAPAPPEFVSMVADFVADFKDPTNGATFFNNPSQISKTNAQYGRTPDMTIGNHAFFGSYGERGRNVAVPSYSVALAPEVAQYAPSLARQTAAAPTPPDRPADFATNVFGNTPMSGAALPGAAAAGPAMADRTLGGYANRNAVTVGPNASLEGLTPNTSRGLGIMADITGGFTVNSANRTADDNKRVGGADRSRHMSGRAIDVDLSGKTTSEKQAIANAGRLAGATEFGLFNNYAHFGFSPPGTKEVESIYNQRIPGWAKDIARDIRTGVPPTPAAVTAAIPPARELGLAARAPQEAPFAQLASAPTGTMTDAAQERTKAQSYAPSPFSSRDTGFAPGKVEQAAATGRASVDPERVAALGRGLATTMNAVKAGPTTSSRALPGAVTAPLSSSFQRAPSAVPSAAPRSFSPAPAPSRPAPAPAAVQQAYQLNQSIPSPGDPLDVRSQAQTGPAPAMETGLAATGGYLKDMFMSRMSPEDLNSKYGHFFGGDMFAPAYSDSDTTRALQEFANSLEPNDPRGLGFGFHDKPSAFGQSLSSIGMARGMLGGALGGPVGAAMGGLSSALSPASAQQPGLGGALTGAIAGLLSGGPLGAALGAAKGGWGIDPLGNVRDALGNVVGNVADSVSGRSGGGSGIGGMSSNPGGVGGLGGYSGFDSSGAHSRDDSMSG
jgi:hypothetical protein